MKAVPYDGIYDLMDMLTFSGEKLVSPHIKEKIMQDVCFVRKIFAVKQKLSSAIIASTKSSV